MNHYKTIAIVNQKGGVGQTTSTVNLGVGLAQAGNRVLLVDDDPQHSLTISLGIRNADDDLDTTLATAMQAEIRDESVPWEEGIIHSGEGVDLLPANIELSGVEMSLFNAMSRDLGESVHHLAISDHGDESPRGLYPAERSRFRGYPACGYTGTAGGQRRSLCSAQDRLCGFRLHSHCHSALSIAVCRKSLAAP